MKKIITTFVLLISLFINVFAQSNNDIIGEWYNAEKDAIITIYEDGKTISGKTTWMLNPNDENGEPKKDLLNKDKNLRDRDRLGLVLMKGFVHIEGNVWDNGRLYNPKDGKTYTGMITLEDKNTLDLRGYVGFSFLGKSTKWTRKVNE